MNIGNNISGYGYYNNAVTGYAPAQPSGAPAENGLGIKDGDALNKTGKCETCENRKYQDGSDEMVSFKSAAKISPEASAVRVRAHEQEHVSNAYKKASQNNGKVLSASVALKTSICPDCGKAYVSGGTTSTKIRYSDEENPYQKNLKQMHETFIKGLNFDKAV